jgi:hypothetical protein
MENKGITVKFNERTTFWDVEGIPVTLNGGEGIPYSAAWDSNPPRKFDPDSVRRNGAEISRQQFEALVDSVKGPKPPSNTFSPS